MNQPAPTTGTPAPQAPGPGTGTPAPTEFKAPWSDVQGTYMIGEGEAAKPWFEGIQEPEIKEYIKTKNYANPYEAARAAWNANQMNKLSPDIEAFVNGKATPEQEKAIYNKLGRPETADKYELKADEGVTVDPELEKLGRDIFHETGMNQKQANLAYNKWNKAVVTMNAAKEEAARVQNDTELKALETKFGADLEKNKAAGNRAVKALGLDNALIEKVEKNIGSAAMVEMLVAIGRKSDEGTFKAGGDGGDPNDPSNMTKEQATAKIKELQADDSFQKRYTDKKDPGHPAALALMEKLFVKAG